MPKIKNFKIIISISLVLIITALAFFPSIKNGFVNWDDDKYVTENNVIHFFSFRNVKQIFSSFFVCNYQPVSVLSYLLEYQFFKLSPLGYHITNLVLHLLNSLLVFWLIFVLTRKVGVSLPTALLFGIHPLHVESVAWISERKDVLYALFFLCAIVSYCYYLKKSRSLKYYFFALFSFVLSLLSKAMAITLPLVLLLLDWYMHRKHNKTMFIDKIPFFILSFIFGAIAIFGQYSGAAVRKESLLNFFHKIGIVSYSIIFYLGKTLVPIRLSSLYPYHGIKDISSYLYDFILVVVLIIIVAFSIKHTRKIVFGSAVFLATLLPVLQFIPIGATIVADRYIYIPSLGIFYLLSEGFFWLYLRKTKHIRSLQSLILAIFIGIISTLALFTWKRCYVWKDSISLWNDVLTQYPYVTFAYNNRGLAYQNTGDFSRAIADYNKALAIDPNYASAYNYRGLAYQNTGDFSRAMADYNKALAIDPSLVGFYLNRGLAYQNTGDFNRAMADYNKALAIDPNYAPAYNNRGWAYQNTGDFSRAMADYNKALAIDPNYAFAYNNRGLAYQNTGDFSRAMADYNKALAIDPSFIIAYLNRGFAYQNTGDFSRAMADYNKALAIDPNYARSYYNRAILYFIKQDYGRSWEDVHKAELLGFRVDAEFLKNLREATSSPKR